MQVFWSKAAKQDRYDIALYISQESVDAACNMLDRFDQAARQLEKFPLLAPEGRVKGTRELVVHKHYILVYEIINEAVIILAVLHTAKQYPPLLQ
jgi:addiction module RelE/StbE family toxin